MAALNMKWIKFAVILFYLLLFVGLALYDEKPDPELAREMSRPLPEVVEQGNAWIIFLGFASPKGVSPYVHGEEKMRKLQDAMRTEKNSKRSGNPLLIRNPSFPSRGRCPLFTARKMAGCWHTP